MAENNVKEEKKIKRGRGRPPGSRNKSTLEKERLAKLAQEQEAQKIEKMKKAEESPTSDEEASDDELPDIEDMVAEKRTKGEANEDSETTEEPKDEEPESKEEPKDEEDTEKACKKMNIAKKFAIDFKSNNVTIDGEEVKSDTKLKNIVNRMVDEASDAVIRDYIQNNMIGDELEWFDSETYKPEAIDNVKASIINEIGYNMPQWGKTSWTVPSFNANVSIMQKSARKSKAEVKKWYANDGPRRKYIESRGDYDVVYIDDEDDEFYEHYVIEDPNGEIVQWFFDEDEAHEHLWGIDMDDNYEASASKKARKSKVRKSADYDYMIATVKDFNSFMKETLDMYGITDNFEGMENDLEDYNEGSIKDYGNYAVAIWDWIGKVKEYEYDMLSMGVRYNGTGYTYDVELRLGDDSYQYDTFNSAGEARGRCIDYIEDYAGKYINKSKSTKARKMKTRKSQVRKGGAEMMPRMFKVNTRYGDIMFYMDGVEGDRAWYYAVNDGTPFAINTPYDDEQDITVSLGIKVEEIQGDVAICDFTENYYEGVSDIEHEYDSGECRGDIEGGKITGFWGLEGSISDALDILVEEAHGRYQASARKSRKSKVSKMDIEDEYRAQIEQVEFACQVDNYEVYEQDGRPYMKFSIYDGDCEYYFDEYNIEQENGYNIICLDNVPVMKSRKAVNMDAKNIIKSRVRKGDKIHLEKDMEWLINSIIGLGRQYDVTIEDYSNADIEMFSDGMVVGLTLTNNLTGKEFLILVTLYESGTREFELYDWDTHTAIETSDDVIPIFEASFEADEEYEASARKSRKASAKPLTKSRGIKLAGHSGTFRVIKKNGPYAMLESEQLKGKAYNVILKGHALYADDVDGMKDKRAKVMMKTR